MRMPWRCQRLKLPAYLPTYVPTLTHVLATEAMEASATCARVVPADSTSSQIMIRFQHVAAVACDVALRLRHVRVSPEC